MAYQLTYNRIMRVGLALLIILSLIVMPVPFGKTAEVYAKTDEAQKAENLFFYVKNSAGQDVLLKVLTLGELKGMQHGNGSGNYYYSATDNLPAVVYTEAKGFTVPELITKVKTSPAVSGEDNITFAGNDTIDLMATDSGGNYARSWTYNALYGKQGYYFKDIFKSDIGWKQAWEITGDGYNPQSPDAMPYSVYESKYKSKDTYAGNKDTVASTKTEMPAILSVTSQGDRIGDLIEEYGVSRNNITGALSTDLSDENALTLSLPQTEDIFYSGNRTMYHCFKWIYNIRLDMATDPVIEPLGEVAAPTADVRIDPGNADRLLVDFDCATAGADIYYSVGENTKSIKDSNAKDYGTAPVKKYTAGTPVSIDLNSGADLKSSPVKIYMKAVKEGYTDKPIASVSYPAQSPALRTVPDFTVGSDVVLTGADSVSSEAWEGWTYKISSVTMRAPSASAYAPIDAGKYSVNNGGKTLTLDKSLFTEAGYHTFKIDADGYSTKTVEVSMSKAAPSIAPVTAFYGERIDIPIADAAYLSAVSVSVKKDGAGTGSAIPSKYIVKSAGRLTVSAGYFSDAGTKITEPGKYIIGLSANDYEPSVNNVSVTIKPEGDNAASAFEYALAVSNATPKTGEKITVTAKLSSNNGSYTFYGGQYRVAVDANLAVSNIKNANGWESGISSAGGKTVLTFAKLDTTGDGVLHAAVSNIGTFDLTAGSAAGTGNITVTSALLTDDVGLARSRVTGKGLSISIVKRTPTTPATPDVSDKGKEQAAAAKAQKEAEDAVKKLVPKAKAVTLSVSKKAVTVKIKAVKGALKYKIRYRVKGTKKWKTKTITPAQAKKGYKIKGLKKGKRYEIQYAVIKKAGKEKKAVSSKWSKSIITKKVK